MPKTRSKGTSATSAETPAQCSSKYQLPDGVVTPPRLLILPAKASAEARVVSLPNPQSSKAAKYLVCPESGIFEITRFTTETAEPRSWLIEADNESEARDGDKTGSSSLTTKEADLYVATDFDALFMALPALAHVSHGKAAEQKKRMFMSVDDYFDSVGEFALDLSEMLRWKRIRDLLESRMATVCDTVDAGDETMFRLNEARLLAEILSKARRGSDGSLPASMEQKFVLKVLEAPIMSIRSTAVRDSPNGTVEAGEGTATPQTESSESQASVSIIVSTSSSLSEASTAATSVSAESDSLEAKEEVVAALQASEEIIRLQRLRVAFKFICARYMPPILAKRLNDLLAAERNLVDFTPLDEYRAKLNQLRQDALNSRSLSDYSRKRPFDEEDEERAEKRRKKEEEEKRRKANESRGVKELKKVNVSGMKKMSEFFKKR